MSWEDIARELPRHGVKNCQNRYYKHLNDGVARVWTVEKDRLLTALREGGTRSWRDVAEQLPGQTIQSCMDRYHHHLKDGATRGARRNVGFLQDIGGLFVEERDEVLADGNTALQDREACTDDEDIYPPDEDVDLYGRDVDEDTESHLQIK
jgi:hypothetical protein